MPDLKINEIDFYSKKFVFISLQKEYLYSWIILQVSYILKDVYLIKNMFFRFFLETTCSKLAGLSFRKIVNLVRKKTSCKLKKTIHFLTLGFELTLVQIFVDLKISIL